MIPRALAAMVTINPSIPLAAANTVPGMVQGIYLFALSLAGILAFGAIVYGGIKYALGRGNPSSESEGKSWITGALLGLLLLAGAYLILQTVNPALVTLGNPLLPALQTPTLPQAATTGVYGCVAANGIYACSTATDSNCSAAVGCAGETCIMISSVSECGQPASAFPCGNTTCSPASQVCWNSASPPECVAAIGGKAACGSENGGNNGPCANKSQKCTLSGGTWSCK